MMDKIARLCEALMRKGELSELRAWCEAVPARLRRMDPGLSMWLAWALALGLNPESAQPHARAAESRLVALAASAARADADETVDADVYRRLNPQAIRGQLALILGIVARRMGRGDEALAWLTRARQLIPANDGVLAAVIDLQLGYLAWESGNLGEAGREFAQAARLAERERHPLFQVAALGGLAATRRRGGHTQDAKALVERAGLIAD